jgi:diguanylate cyclase
MINPEDERRADGVRFTRRMHAPRAAGLGLGFFCVAAPFWQAGAHPLAWGALFLHAFAWPHLAYAIARRSRNPFRTERRNLTLDSALGGVWVVLMGFNLLPSVVLITALSMDKVSVGGWRFLGRTAAAMLAAGALTALLFGVNLRLETTMLTVLACIPFMVTYPMAIGVVTYQLTRRVREQNRQLAAMSRVDGLSGLANRIHWEEAVESEYHRFLRGGRPSSLLMIDIDHFKGINDRHGHAAGDEVIRGMGAILRRCLRKADMAGRYGGEEFGVLLPDTGEQGAAAIAERIRAAIASTDIDDARRLRCTVSIGVATLASGTHGYHDWMNRADRALYAAKAGGRDRIQTAGTTAG